MNQLMKEICTIRSNVSPTYNLKKTLKKLSKSAAKICLHTVLEWMLWLPTIVSNVNYILLSIVSIDMKEERNRASSFYRSEDW